MNREQKIFSLSTVLNRVQTVFDDFMSGKYFWIKVELSKVNFDRKGHVYIELVENNEGNTLAKCRATIWKRNADVILQKLGDQSKDILKDGAEILCCCEVVFSPVYGFSINITDIDLAFSLGEVERKKQETIEQLRKLDLLTKNAKRDLATVLQRIALIGSVGTAGHEDFVRQLEKNKSEFVYNITYFDCRVQGEGSEMDICDQFNKINVRDFDVVVLVRGGGSKFDLETFNSYALSSIIANFELPVFTGIGHETDSSVVDFVSHTYFKTPSAVAAFIVEHTLAYYSHIIALYKGVLENYNRKMIQSTHELDVVADAIKNRAVASTIAEKNNLLITINSLVNEVGTKVRTEYHVLNLASQLVSFQPKVITNRRASKLDEMTKMFALLANNALNKEKQLLASNVDVLPFYCRNSIKKEYLRMDKAINLLDFFDLSAMMKKGLAIVRLNNKLLNAHSLIKEGDILEIEVYNKVFEVTVKDSKEIHKWKNLLMTEHQAN